MASCFSWSLSIESRGRATKRLDSETCQRLKQESQGSGLDQSFYSIVRPQSCHEKNGRLDSIRPRMLEARISNEVQIWKINVSHLIV